MLCLDLLLSQSLFVCDAMNVSGMSVILYLYMLML